MPNLCTNKLIVLEETEDENQRFLETAKRLSFNAIITQPPELIIEDNSLGSEEDDA